MNIFALWGEIEINRRKAETDIVAVEKQAGKSGKQMESSFDKVTKVVGTAIKEVGRFGKKVVTVGKDVTKQAGIPLAAMTALAGGLAKTTADYGDAVAKSAQEVGMGVVAYQELGYALGQNNLNAEETLRVFGRLNQRIGLARNGNENYRKSLEKMGISMEELDKGAIGTEETFVQILESLSQMPDSQMQAAYASDIFGTMLSRKMMPLIRSGAEGIEELRSRAHELGIVMDEEAARKSELFGDTMSDLTETSKGFGRSISQELLAPFVNIATWMTDIIAKGTEWVRENPKLVRQIIMFGGAIAGVLSVLVTLGTTMVVTGKIIGALGTIFNILTSKPLLIIAAIGLLWLAWENDWGNIRTTTEEVVGTILALWDSLLSWWDKSKLKGWIVDTWGQIRDVWDDEDLTLGQKVLSSVSIVTNKIIDLIPGLRKIWEKEDLSLGEKVLETLKLIPGAQTVIDFIENLRNKIMSSKAWEWTMDVAVPAIIDTGKLVIDATVELTGKIYDAVKKGFKTGDWSDALGIGADLWQKGVVLALGLKLLAGAGAGILSAIGSIFGNATGALGAGGIGSAIGLLSVGIQLAEAKAKGSFASFGWNMFTAIAAGIGASVIGGPGAGMMVFTIALNLKLGENLKETHDEILDLKPLYEKWFKEQQKNMTWFEKLNPFAQPSYDDFLEEYRSGAIKAGEAYAEGIEQSESVVFEKVENMAKGIGDYLIGQSPPPKGPLSEIDKGGAKVMEAWADGAGEGLDGAKPKLTQALESIKGLFASVWDKVPEEIKEPIETAMTYIGDLMGKAEEALWDMEEMQKKLDELFGGGSDPEGEAQGFMARLAAGLKDKLKLIDDPLNYLVEAVSSSARTLLAVGKALASRDLAGAFLTILMETESFALAMELLGTILQPVITLFDNVLRPVIEFIIGLWNAVMEGLSNISIFGWRPFKGLEDKIIDTDKDKGGGSDKSSGGGRQVSEITGPTRDLLVDLLTPLANFGAIVAPIQDIRNILYEHLPNFNNMEFGMATTGAGGMGSIVFEAGSIVIDSPATDSGELSRNMLDEIEREMARRIGLGIRGRGGRQ